jgi:cation/acetate symporter
MTASGAIAGLATGSVIAIVLFLVALAQPGWSAASLLLTPTPVAAPSAVLAAMVVSRRTSVPDDLGQLWVRLHGTATDRASERLALLTIRGVDGHADRPS